MQFSSSYFQDDILDDVHPYIAAADLLKERGAYKVYVMVTHGILGSLEAPQQLEDSEIDEVGPGLLTPFAVYKFRLNR